MNKSPLEIRHLRTLLAIEDTGSLSKAADLLCITQSAVSHQIKMLEEHYRETLVYKQGGQSRFSLTAQRLLELGRHVCSELDRVELDIRQMQDGAHGPLRVAVECHTCFDWLMPSMDQYRQRWPEVELDIVSGFHSDPVCLLHQGQAELAVVSEPCEESGVSCFPLFQFEMVGVVPVGSALARKPHLQPSDFEGHTLLSYPVPDDMLDVIKHFLTPAQVRPKRRNSELTVALLQLVASGRGISALPAWAVKPYVDRQYVAQVQLGKRGLQSRLYAAVPDSLRTRAYVLDFVEVIKTTSARHLPGIQVLGA